MNKIYYIIDDNYCDTIYNLSKHLKNKIIELVVQKFNDQEIKIHQDTKIDNCKNSFFIQSFSSKERINFLNYFIFYERNNIKDGVLICNYLPYARDIENLQIFIKFLKRHFKKIITIDTHNPKDNPSNCINILPTKIFADKIEVLYRTQNYKNIILISPDDGGREKVIDLQQKLKLRGINTNTSFGKKLRSDKNIQIEIELPKDIENYNCIIVDDIIDSGNTLFEIQRILESKQVKTIDAFITHGLFSSIKKLSNQEKIQSDLYQNIYKFNKLYITNTIDINFQHPKIEIVSAEELILDFINNNKHI